MRSQIFRVMEDHQPAGNQPPLDTDETMRRRLPGSKLDGSSNRRRNWAKLGPMILLPFLTISLSILLLGCTDGPAGSPTSTPTPRRTAPALGPTSTPSAARTSGPTVVPTPTLAPIPTITTSEILLGREKAPVTLLMYSDFDCDLCAAVAADLMEIQSNHSDSVRYAFRPFPLLTIHEKSAQATSAYFAAKELGQGPAMHRALFNRREDWRSLTPAEFRSWLIDLAPELDLDPSSFAELMTEPQTLSSVETAYQQAQASGVPGVPFLFINNQPYLLDLTRTNLEAVVRLALLEGEQFESAPTAMPPQRLPARATLHFNFGAVEIQLFPASAPQAVTSFFFLGRQGWYDNSGLYHVRPGEFVMGGDPTDTGLGNAGFHFEVETDPAQAFDQAGMVALDNAGSGRNSSRFLITLEPRPNLSDSYTIIGRVTSGLDQLDQLSAREPLDDLLQPPEAVLERVSFD
ncbi:MAG: peptidylprolyl isomerase [Anaerolineales bacterium]